MSSPVSELTDQDLAAAVDKAVRRRPGRPRLNRPGTRYDPISYEARLKGVLVAIMYAPGDMTLEQVGKHFSLTRERVRQLCNWVDPELTKQVKENRKRVFQLYKLFKVPRRLLRNEHGTMQSYQERGCRCRLCTDANKAFVEQQRINRIARAAANPKLVPHGTKGGYANWGCRCRPCAEASYAANLPALRRYQQRNKEWKEALERGEV